MKRVSTPLIVIVASCLSACATAPTTTPRAPTPPKRPVISRVSQPELPGKKQRVEKVFESEYTLRGYPTRFPVKPGEVMVVSVPAQTVGEKGAASSEMPEGFEQQLRYAAILGFVASGYKVKDAGVVETSTLSMRRYPATETTESVRVEEVREEGADGNPQVVEKTTTSNPSRDYWWYNKGMTLRLKDPTSLWAPELLTYEKLEADYFLRIFDVTFQPNGNIAVPLKYDIDEQEAQHYRDEVARANLKLSTQNEQIRAYNAKLREYNERYFTYSEEYQNWTNVHAAYFASNGGAPSASAPVSAGEIAERALYSERPLDERLGQRWSEAVDVSLARISAELIDARTGEVAWVGEFTAITERGGADLDVVMIEWARSLARSR